MYLHLAPLFHIGGLSSMLANLMAGARQVVLGRFEPHAALAAIARARVTSLIAVPTMIADLAAAAAAGVEGTECGVAGVAGVGSAGSTCRICTGSSGGGDDDTCRSSCTTNSSSSSSNGCNSNGGQVIDAGSSGTARAAGGVISGGNAGSGSNIGGDTCGCHLPQYPSVLRVLVGAGGMSAPLRVALSRLFPHAALHTAYGMTEAASSITFMRLPRQEEGAGAPGSVGAPGGWLAQGSGSAGEGVCAAGSVAVLRSHLAPASCAGFPGPGIEVSWPWPGLRLRSRE